MPKDTFFNLPDDKRQQICEAALDEFAVYTFDNASVNRIVAEAKIAKGSFYQYFEDKKDLFKYLVGLIGDEKLKYLQPVMETLNEYDLFTALRKVTLAGIRFAQERPRYMAIANWMLGSQNSQIFKELVAENQPTLDDFFASLVKQAAARGEVREDLDVGMLGSMIASMYAAMIEYALSRADQKLDDSILEQVDTFLELLKNGIGKAAEAAPIAHYVGNTNL